MEALETACARSRQDNSLVAVLFLDLNGFKAINDQYGHAAGDALLRDFASRSKAQLRETDLLARYAGDEFVVVLDNLRSERDAIASIGGYAGVQGGT